MCIMFEAMSEYRCTSNMFKIPILDLQTPLLEEEITRSYQHDPSKIF